MAKKKFNDHPFPYRTELELEISTLTNLGVGLGRVTVGEGKWVVMVPFTLPGEKVRARIYRNHKNYSEGDLLAVLTPSPHRVTPKCPIFGTCGGCQYQHLAYAEQLTWKRQQVEELLKYMAGVEFPVQPVIGSPREFGYRSKITPHFRVGYRPFSHNTADAAPDTSAPTREAPIGFLKQGSRFDLVDVPHCDIATPEINAKLPEVRAKTRARLAAGEYKRDATLLLRHAQEGVITDYDAVIHEVIPQLVGPDLRTGRDLAEKGGAVILNRPLAAANPEKAVKDNSPYLEQISSDSRTPPGALTLHFLARDFFQNNPFILPQFTSYAREQAAASGAKFLVDAYCGSGLFALSCAPAFERVAGIELSETSIKFARENAAANGITNTTFQSGDASQIFAGLTFPPADTAVLIDPPRKGCDESFLNQLFAYGPRAVVYVSCDPATQMRDLKNFLTAGYKLTAVQPFDLFPQTRHLECVITLVKG